MSRKAILFKLLVVMGLLSACGGGPSEQEQTAQALGQSIAQTATAAAVSGFNPGANLETAQAQATAGGAALGATQTFQAGLSAEAQAATAAAAAPILAELPKYGVDPAEGRLGWIHPPVSLEVQGFEQFDYINHFIATVATDFVVSVDITWNTQGGLAGCGVVLRSDGNEDALSQYLAIATRSGNGRVIFSSMDQGEVKNAVDLYAFGLDPLFEWRNDTTNRLTVVARGKTFTVYTNGTFIGDVTAGERPVLALPPPPQEPPAGASADQVAAYDDQLAQYNINVNEMQANYQQSLAVFQPNVPYFDRGFVAFVVLNRSGKSLCQFNNGWLFLIDS
jgi:hypothetical protein